MKSCDQCPICGGRLIQSYRKTGSRNCIIRRKRCEDPACRVFVTTEQPFEAITRIDFPTSFDKSNLGIN